MTTLYRHKIPSNQNCKQHSLERVTKVNRKGN